MKNKQEREYTFSWKFSFFFIHYRGWNTVNFYTYYLAKCDIFFTLAHMRHFFIYYFFYSRFLNDHWTLNIYQLSLNPQQGTLNIKKFTKSLSIEELIMTINHYILKIAYCTAVQGLVAIHSAVRGSRQGLFPPRRFLLLNQQLGNDRTWPLSQTYPSWPGESAAAPAAGTSWPRLTPQSSERSCGPLTLDGSGSNVLYLISCQLRLIHSRSIDIWTSTALST